MLRKCIALLVLLAGAGVLLADESTEWFASVVKYAGQEGISRRS